jgi:hypothetical protein
LKSSIFFVPVIFVVVILTLILPRMGRIESAPAEILPSTSLLPTAEAVTSSAAVGGVVRLSAEAIQRSVNSGGAITLEASPDIGGIPAVDDFAAPLLNGNAEDVVGVFVPGLFALPVMQQPKEEPAFVSSANHILTQFSLPKQHGTTGLLAHNYLSGSLFYGLQVDQLVVVVLGDGSQKLYRIRQMERYQALSPTSPYSKFINLTDPTRKEISSGELFSRMYTLKNKLVFQTCIDAEGDPSWGRIFIIAEPVEEVHTSMPTAGQQLYDN